MAISKAHPPDTRQRLAKELRKQPDLIFQQIGEKANLKQAYTRGWWKQTEKRAKRYRVVPAVIQMMLDPHRGIAEIEELLHRLDRGFGLVRGGRHSASHAGASDRRTVTQP